MISNVVSNIKTNHTYTDFENYWAPLIDDDKDSDGDTEEDNVRDQTSMTIQTINNINDTEVQQDLKTILQKWINECANIHKPFHKKESTMVIDSGATSSFVRPEENLPVTGLSSKIVHLSDGLSI